MNSTKSDTDLSKIEHLDFEHAPSCESTLCLRVFGREPHPADWLVTYSECKHVMYWCNQRFMRYRRMRQDGTLLYCQWCFTNQQEILKWVPVKQG